LETTGTVSVAVGEPASARVPFAGRILLPARGAAAPRSVGAAGVVVIDVVGACPGGGGAAVAGVVELVVVVVDGPDAAEVVELEVVVVDGPDAAEVVELDVVVLTAAEWDVGAARAEVVETSLTVATATQTITNAAAISGAAGGRRFINGARAVRRTSDRSATACASPSP
jgi:hypothetical protein